MRRTARHHTPDWSKRRADHGRRGTIYILVLAVAANLVVMGVGAISLLRVRMRGVHAEKERREVRRLAYCGVEQAIAMMNNYTGGTGNWRADYTNDLETTPVDFGDGQVSFKLVDEDGDLADDVTDPVWIYGIGRVGDAVWVERAKARVDQGRPLEFLRTAIHCRGNFEVGTALTAVGAPVSTDGNLQLDQTIDGDAEAVSQSGSGSVTGSLTVPVEKKGMPPQSLFDDYLARATVLTFNGDVFKHVLAPGINEYDGSGTNPDGVYYIDTGGANMQILHSRVHGTLLVDVGAGLLTINTSRWDPYREDFPILICRGEAEWNVFSDTLNEGIGHNFNPPGAPYNSEADADTSDTYPAGLHGLVHVIGNVTFTRLAGAPGVWVVDGAVIWAADPAFVHDPDLMYNPPLGYTDDPNSTAMVIRSGSWSRQPAP